MNITDNSIYAICLTVIVLYVFRWISEKKAPKIDIDTPWLDVMFQSPKTDKEIEEIRKEFESIMREDDNKAIKSMEANRN